MGRAPRSPGNRTAHQTGLIPVTDQASGSAPPTTGPWRVWHDGYGTTGDRQTTRTMGMAPAVGALDDEPSARRCRTSPDSGAATAALPHLRPTGWRRGARVGPRGNGAGREAHRGTGSRARKGPMTTVRSLVRTGTVRPIAWNGPCVTVAERRRGRFSRRPMWKGKREAVP